MKIRLSRREFLGPTAPLTLASPRLPQLSGQSQDLLLFNGRIHTMDSGSRVVSQVLIRNGRFDAVANGISARGARRIDLKGRPAIPGLIDAHNHIVLVGNRPGWHTPLEHVFTIPDAVAALKARAAGVPAGGVITTVGPVAEVHAGRGR